MLVRRVLQVFRVQSERPDPRVPKDLREPRDLKGLLVPREPQVLKA